MYTAIVLNEESANTLKNYFKEIPDNWKIYCHHMTINMGDANNGPAKKLIDSEVKLRVVSIAKDEKVLAVGVETDVPSNNSTKHITVAVNLSKGKPKDSNNLKNWEAIEPFELTGKVEVCK